MGRGRSKDSIISFNAGEFSPYLDARVDTPKFKAGCRQLQNAILEVYGAARRRPGLQFIASAKYHDKQCRLEDFRFSTSTTFTLEVGDLYMRFFSNGAQVESTPGTPYEIVTPWAEADLFELQFAQINDVTYIVHPDYPPYKLSRVADDNWTLAAVSFLTPALLDENTNDTYKLKLSATSGSGIDLEATGHTPFLAAHVGSYWQLSHARNANSVELALTSTANSSNQKALGAWNVRTYGTWTGTLVVERSDDGGTTWVAVRKFTGQADRNVDATGTAEEEALYRLNFTHVSNTGSPRAVFEVVDAYVDALVKVTAFVSSSKVTVDVIKVAESTADTVIWREGAWSAVRGYPKAVTLHEQRLCFAGTSYQAQTIWGSVISDYENFAYGTDDTDAFAYTLGAKERNAVQWLSSQTALLIGTAGGEWIMSSGDDVNPISPTNVVVRRQTNYGSNAIGALLVNSVTMFVQRQGRRVREMTYVLENDRYDGAELTLLAEHITGSGIVQMAYQQQRNSIVWAVTEEGDLIGMTYERAQEVQGWHRHVTDGLFESVATIYGEDEDEVWVVVNRTIGGATKRYIERFNPFRWTEKVDCFFVDSGLSYDGSPASTFSGLDHLEGKTVSILADGAVVPDQVVSGGAITLPDDLTASIVHIGLPFETVVQPMRLDLDPIVGNSQGQVKQVREVFFRLKDSLGLRYGDGEREYNLSFRATNDYMDASAPLFTGDKLAEFEGAFDFDTPVIVKQSQPLPLTLLALIIKYQVTGN